MQSFVVQEGEMKQKRYIFFAFLVLLLAGQYKPVLASSEDNFQKKIDSYVRTAASFRIK
jgi:hypothetical protein